MIKRKTLWNSYIVLKAVGDLVFAFLIFFLSYYVRFYSSAFTKMFPPLKGIPELKYYYDFIPFYLAVVFFSHIYCGFYKKELLGMIDEFIVKLKSALLIGILIFAVSFFYRSYEYSRLFMLLMMSIYLVVTVVWHELIKHLYKKYVKYFFGKPRVGVVVSEGKMHEIKKKVLSGRAVKLFFLNRFSRKEDVLDFINKRNLNELIIEYSIFNSSIFQELLAELDLRGVDLKILFDVPVKLSDTIIDSTLGFPVVGIKPLSLTGFNFLIKRSIDIFFSILVFTVIFIPSIFILILIKLDSKGSAFFVHKRAGLKGRYFNCVKLRTMVADAHNSWQEMLKFSERGEKVFKMKNDPRITSIGKYLRKWSIDELPQFFNVLKGDMSVIGPRPQIIEEVGFYDHFAKRRLMVPAGLTGLWQISGRADIGFEDMVKLDIYYLENWSLGLDLKILFKTVTTVFSKKGAY